MTSVRSVFAYLTFLSLSTLSGPWSAAAQGSSSQTALDATIKLQGPRVTPFTANNQNLLINALTSVMTTVSRADITIRYYTSDDARIATFGRRKLLSSQGSARKLMAEVVSLDPQLTFGNTVWLTLQINAGTSARTQTVQNDLQAALSASGPYNAVPVQQALQSYGQPGWSLNLLSSAAVDPSQALPVELLCMKKFGSFCLDNSGISPGGVKAVIAVGCIVVVLVPAILCVYLDIRRKSGKMGEAQSVPETPRTPMQRAVNSITDYLRTSFAAIRTPRGSATKKAPFGAAPTDGNQPVPGFTGTQEATATATVHTHDKDAVVSTDKAEALPSKVRVEMTEPREAGSKPHAVREEAEMPSKEEGVSPGEKVETSNGH